MNNKLPIPKKPEQKKPEPNWRDRLPRCIRNDFGRKAGSVLLVALIYFAYYTHPSAEREFSAVNVQLEMAPGLMPVAAEPLQVKLKLKGSQKQLDDLKASDLKVIGRVSEQDFRPVGKTPVYLKDRDVTGLPLGVQIVDIISRDLMVDLDREKTVEKTIKVEFDPRAQLPQGCALGRVEAVPAEVTLRGPEKQLQSIVKIATQPVPLENASSGFTYLADLQLPNGVTAEPAQVSVQVEVINRISSTQVSGVPVLLTTALGNAPKKVRISPDKVTVTLNGPENALQGIKVSDLLATVRWNGDLGPGTYHLPVRVIPNLHGKEIEVRRVIPEEVEIEIR